MSLLHDIVLDDMAFMNASSDMKELKIRTENLKTRLKHMYKDLTTAMDTPAGNAVEAMTESVLIKPIDDMKCLKQIKCLWLMLLFQQCCLLEE